MSIATNLLIIVLGVNVMLFAFGNPEVNSPILGVVKGFYLTFTGAPNWSSIITSFGTSLWIYALLIGIVAAASFATGANYLTTGGGHGALVALQVLGIAIFSSLLLMPNFAAFDFPATILFIVQAVFGTFITVTVISLLRGGGF